MNIDYTQEALSDLEEAYIFLSREWPDILDRFERRLAEIERLVSEHPESGNEVKNRQGVYAIAFVRYPYKIFYRIGDERIEILHIFHTSRRQS